MNTKKTVWVLSFLFFFIPFSGSNLWAQGHFEFGVHYSSWSLNLIKSEIESAAGDIFEGGIKEQFLDDIQQDYPGLEEQFYDQDISFDSGGSNYGVEIRWYPGGHNGIFSLGLSLEKTHIKVFFPELSAQLDLKDPVTGKEAFFTGDAQEVQFEMNPLSFHLSLRWDINPTWRVRPYITLGVGAATGTALEEATFSLAYTGVLSIEGETETYEGSETKSLKELKEELEEEEDFTLPPVIPFLQLNLGLKGQLTQNLYLLVDAGIWNGFLLRGGASLRF